MYFYDKNVKASSRPPVIGDVLDGVLSDDRRFKKDFFILMNELKEIFYDKIKTSKPGDTLLVSASKKYDERENMLLGKLKDLYERKHLNNDDVERLVEEFQGKLLAAATKVKPSYDKWKQNTKEMQGPFSVN